VVVGKRKDWKVKTKPAGFGKPLILGKDTSFSCLLLSEGCEMLHGVNFGGVRDVINFEFIGFDRAEHIVKSSSLYDGFQMLKASL